jgi:hypothetical protein
MPSHICQQLEPGKFFRQLRTVAGANEITHNGTNATIALFGAFPADSLIRLGPPAAALFAIIVEVGQ